MKWAVRLVGLLGLAWGALTTLYAVGVVLLAPLAVRTDSADFRNALLWLGGILLFMASSLFLVVFNLLLQRPRFQLANIMLGLLCIVIYVPLLITSGFNLQTALLFAGGPFICWGVVVLYLLTVQRADALARHPIERTEGVVMHESADNRENLR